MINAWLGIADSSAMMLSYHNNAPLDWIKTLSTKPDIIFNTNHDWLNVQYSHFIHRQKDIHQIVLQNKQTLIFRLFIKGEKVNDYYELSFIVHRGFINRIIKSVESSIGSINFLNNK
ncbi:MAG: hypothetical protein Q7J34_06295 [Bacteroidales bacterium]|nr:hypothetical protein [Bacteroidales bacterium]